MKQLLRTLRYRTDWYAILGAQLAVAAVAFLLYRYAGDALYALLQTQVPFDIPFSDPRIRRWIELAALLLTVVTIWRLPRRLRRIGWIFTPQEVPPPDPEAEDQEDKPPTRIGRMLDRLVAVKEQPYINHIITKWQKDRLTYTAGSIAWSVFVLMIPLTVLVVLVALKIVLSLKLLLLLNFDSIELDGVLDKIFTILNDMIGNKDTVQWIKATFMEGVKNQFSKFEHAPLYTFILMFSWSVYQAACVNQQLMYYLDNIYDIEVKNRRSALKVYLISAWMTALQILVILSVIALMGWIWPWLSHLACSLLNLDEVPKPINAAGKLFITTWAVATLYWILFRYGPSERAEHRWVQPGSWVGTIAFVILTMATFTMVPKLFHYDTFGQAVGLILLTFWLKNASVILVIAAEVNKFADVRRVLKEGEPERRRLRNWFRRRAEHPLPEALLHIPPPVDLMVGEEQGADQNIPPAPKPNGH